MYRKTRLLHRYKVSFKTVTNLNHSGIILWINFWANEDELIGYKKISRSMEDENGNRIYHKVVDLLINEAWDVTLICDEDQLNCFSFSECEGLNIQRAADTKEFICYIHIVKISKIGLLKIPKVLSIWYVSCTDISYDSCTEISKVRGGTLLRNVENLCITEGTRLRIEVSDEGFLHMDAHNIDSFTIWIKQNIESDFFKD